MNQNSKPFKPPVFNHADYESWKVFLQEEGYVVLKDILSLEEIETAFNLFKKDINSVSPRFQFDNPETQNINSLPAMYGKGMLVFNGFGQSDAMWNLRTNKTILSVFKKIYDCEDLVTSLDGFSVFVSHEQKSKSWLHIDQNPKNSIYSFKVLIIFFQLKTDRMVLLVVQIT